MTNPVILVVEDEPLIMMSLVDSLEAHGHEVLTAFNADRALRILAARAGVDLLFTDINLPGGVTGLALARMAREKRPTLPVIYASGRYGGLLEGEGVPGSRFLPKPYRPSAVLAEIETALAASAHKAAARELVY